MREAELWIRMDKVLGPHYSRAWAEQVVMQDLGSRTVAEAIVAGITYKEIWRAVWVQLELTETQR